MSNIIKYDFQGHDVRIVQFGKEDWWIAKDVCDVLEHSNYRMAVDSLDPDEKGVSIVDTPGGPQEMLTITEAGLYKLILRSRKPQAKAFSRWVTHEVLPQIRKTGAYMAAGGEFGRSSLRLDGLNSRLNWGSFTGLGNVALRVSSLCPR